MDINIHQSNIKGQNYHHYLQMKTYVELKDERQRLFIKINDLLIVHSHTEKYSVDYTALETTITLLRIQFAQIQQEIIDTFPAYYTRTVPQV